jgi:phospholipid/cholesterol/gamma-HCH transport system substrate-binding protein
MKISKEAKIGILALAAGVMLYFGFNFLKGKHLFSSNNRYYAVYPNILGLTESNPVMLNGKIVGKVLSTDFIKKQNNAVLVTLEIRNDLILNDSTLATIDVSLLGSKSVILSIGDGKKTKNNNDTLIARLPKDILGSIQSQAGPVIDSFNLTLGVLNQRMREFKTTQENLNKLLLSFSQTSNTANNTLEENRIALKAALTNMNGLTAALNDPKTGIKPLIGKFNTLGDSLSALHLSETLNKANHSVANLNQMLAKVNEGQGSLGKLLKSDSLHIASVKAISDLDSLFVDLKAHPKRYVSISVFGKKDKPAKKK